MEDLSISLGTSAPPIDPTMGPAQVEPHVLLATNEANKLALGLTPTLWDKTKDSLGSVQYSLSSKFRSLGGGAAKLMGADERSGGNVGEVSGLVLFWALVAGVLVLIAYKGRKLFGKRAIKL